MMVRLPFWNAAVSSSSSPSSTRATSATRMAWLFTSRTTICPTAAGLVTRPCTRRVSSVGPACTVPPGVVRFCVAIARCTSAATRLIERSATGSIHTLICRLRPPTMLTCPTPAMLSIPRRMRLSAISVISRTGRSACTET